MKSLYYAVSLDLDSRKLQTQLGGAVTWQKVFNNIQMSNIIFLMHSLMSYFIAPHEIFKAIFADEK